MEIRHHPRHDSMSPTSTPTARGRRRSIPEARLRHLRLWLHGGAALTVLILVVGGITRLTQSGLSIVDWAPLMGVVPPLDEADWRAAFARYQQFPEYRMLRPDMTLAQFQVIFFWEYTHRLLARLIGLAFLVPFALFSLRGYFDAPLRRRVLLLFALGALQGFMGWFMVRSGLVDDPRVSHYRLAAHLGIALTIFAYCLWLARDLRPRRAAEAEAAEGDAGVRARRWVHALGALLLLQILWGAFVAGLDAGLVYNTFPRMGAGLVPPEMLRLEPALRNLVANPVAVQWVHRLLGTLLLLGVALHALAARGGQGEGRARALGRSFALLVAVQYALGVLTLLLRVPVSLGVLHQVTAVAILGVWVTWLHQLHRAPRP